MPNPEPRAEELRVTAELRRAVERSGVPMREVDRRCGWPQNRTSQLLRGRWGLRYRDLVAILQAVELPPRRFLLELYEEPSESGVEYGELSDVLKLLVRNAVQRGDIDEDEIRAKAPGLLVDDKPA